MNHRRPPRVGVDSLAAALLVALVFLGLAWELFLAPLAPGGSWLVLKVVPLLAALPGVLRGRRYTLQWSTLLIWLYAAEGATRAYTDLGVSARLGALEFVLALGYFAAAVATLRSTRRATSPTPIPPAPGSPR